MQGSQAHSKLSSARHVFFVGIKGAGVVALAELLAGEDPTRTIAGSDVDAPFYTDAILARIGVTPVPLDAPLPSGADALVYSTAYPETQVQISAARAAGIPVWSYPEAVGELTADRLTLAVCGTHGKTTTSALLAHTLEAVGKSPSAIVGSLIHTWGGSARVGQSKLLVLEADEYQDKLRHYTPYITIITSLDHDHPDVFPTAESYEAVFENYLKRTPRFGLVVWCRDDLRIEKLMQRLPPEIPRISYGFHPDSDLCIEDWRVAKPSERLSGLLQSWRLASKSDVPSDCVALRLAGRHNACNAAAVYAVCQALGVSADVAAGAMATFTGTERRFQYRGTLGGALFYDDYGHHPVEIAVTLQAFRELFPDRRLRVFFQPHTFSRTAEFFYEFAESLTNCDEVGVVEIFGSAREVHGGVSSQQLVDAVNERSTGVRYSIYSAPSAAKAHFYPDIEGAATYIRETLRNGDLILTLGAGDTCKIPGILGVSLGIKTK
jgi:UDP-N-acetylmuramate--alanine ligase